MTSLQETLPLLDQAVPALPGKVEAIQHEADGFEQVAREAVARFQEKRNEAGALVDAVRGALEALRDRATGERDGVERVVASLHEAAEEEARGLEEGADELSPVADTARAAFETLDAGLEQGAQRARAAHDEARTALATLDDQSREGQRQVGLAVEKTTDSLGHARDAIVEGQAEVAGGVAALAEAVGRNLQRAQARLERTLSRLDELRNEQEQEITDTVALVATRCQDVEDILSARMNGPISDEVASRLETVETALGELGTQVTQLDTECRARREELEPPLASVGDRIPPLQGSVEQVKRAADQVGIGWP